MGRTSGKYNNLDNDHGKHNDCIAEALKTCLPKAFAALYYLYFMGSQKLKETIKGGQWSGQNVNGPSQDLFNWLTTDKTVGGYSDTRTLTPGLIRRGFDQGELKDSNKGQTVATAIAKMIKHNTPGDFQNVLLYLLFVCPWHDSLLGHACLFLHKFCSEVETDSVNAFRGEFEEKYSGKKYDELKELCRTLKSQLDSLVNGTQGGLSAVCHGNTNLFNDLWDESKFDKYCDWLKRNIYRIIASLVSMSQDCPDWNSSSIQSGGNAGPFKYGFVFKDNEWNGNINSKLSPLISKLTGEDSGSLQKFISFLDNPSTPSSAGATAGGVVTGLLGTGGLGAGAAYATNAFGFKNFITSFISSFLK